MNKEPPNGLKSVSKAMGLLAKFDERRREWGITEIARELKMPKSTAHAIIKSLEQAGILEQTDSSRYRLGVMAFQLGYVARVGTNIEQLATPLLEDLFARTEQIIYLAVPHAGQVLYIESYYQSPRIKVNHSIAGRTGPMHSTGLGKAMLSQMDEEAVDRIIQTHGLPRFTDYTITDPEQLKKELEITRKRGYATDYRETDPMIGCVAMPFRVRDGGLAAVSVSGSYTVFTESKILDFVDGLAHTCSALSRRLERLPFKVNMVPE